MNSSNWSFEIVGVGFFYSTTVRMLCKITNVGDLMMVTVSTNNWRNRVDELWARVRIFEPEFLYLRQNGWLVQKWFETIKNYSMISIRSV